MTSGGLLLTSLVDILVYEGDLFRAPCMSCLYMLEIHAVLFHRKDCCLN